MSDCSKIAETQERKKSLVTIKVNSSPMNFTMFKTICVWCAVCVFFTWNSLELINLILLQKPSHCVS